MRRIGMELDITTQFYHSLHGQLFRVADVVRITNARALKPKPNDCARNEDRAPSSAAPPQRWWAASFPFSEISTQHLGNRGAWSGGRKHRGGAAMGYSNGLNMSFEKKPGRLLTPRKMANEESTLISDRGRIARYIIPLFGRMTVKSVERNDIERFMHDFATGKTAGMD
jgi:hypothetical protein